MSSTSNCIFYFRIPTAEEWAPYLANLQRSGLPVNLHSLYSQNSGILPELVLPSLLECLKLFCDKEEQYQNLPIQQYALDFITDETVLYHTANVLDYGYRVTLRQLMMFAMTAESIQQAAAIPTWSQEGIRFATSAATAIQQGDWAGLWEAIQLGLKAMPENPFISAFAAEVAFIRGDGLADLNAAALQLNHILELHQAQALPENLMKTVTSLGTMIGLIQQDYSAAAQFIAIGLKYDPQNINQWFDNLRILLAIESPVNLENARLAITATLNGFSDDLYYLCILAFSIEPLFQKIFIHQDWFADYIDRFTRVLTELESLVGTLTNFYNAEDSTLASDIVPISNMLQWYRAALTTKKAIIGLRALQFYRETLNQRLGIMQTSLRTEGIDQIHEEIDILLQVNQLGLSIHMPEHVISQARELFSFETNEPNSELQWFSELQSFQNQYQPLLETCRLVIAEIPEINQQIHDLELNIRREKPKSGHSLRFVFTQLFYIAAALVLWYYVGIVTMEGGVKGAAVFISMFAIAFSVLIKPMELFRQLGGVSSNKRLIQQYQIEISKNQSRKNELVTMLQNTIHQVTH